MKLANEWFRTFWSLSNLEFSDLTATVQYQVPTGGRSGARVRDHHHTSTTTTTKTIQPSITNQPTGGAKSKYCDCVGYVGRGPGDELNIVGRMKIVFHATEKNIGVYTKHSSTQVGIGIFFAMSR